MPTKLKLVNRVIKSVVALLLLIVGCWGWYKYVSCENQRSIIALNTTLRLQALAHSIQDGMIAGKTLPTTQDKLWDFLAGDAPIGVNLDTILCDEQGRPFQYKKLSSNEFVVSFTGMVGTVRFVCSETNTTLEYPD